MNRDTTAEQLIENLHNKMRSRVPPEQMEGVFVILFYFAVSSLTRHKAFLKETKPFQMVEIARPAPSLVSGNIEVF